jgi:hypothetical protein
MLNAKFIVYAKAATIDSFSNQLSISNVIEVLEAPEMPALIQESVLIILFERDTKKDSSKHQINLRLLENKKLIGEKKFDIDFESGDRNRTLVTMPILQLTSFGVLSFEISANKKVVASYTALINKVENKGDFQRLTISAAKAGEK